MPKGNSLIAALSQVTSLQVARNEVKERVAVELEGCRQAFQYFNSQFALCALGSEAAEAWIRKADRAAEVTQGLQAILNREALTVKGDGILINLEAHIIVIKCLGDGLCYVASVNNVKPRGKYKAGKLPKLGQVFKSDSPRLMPKVERYSLAKDGAFSFHWYVNNIEDLKPAKVFTVVVEEKYFKQIKSGNKWREYRVIKPHWTNRLIDAKTGKNKPFDSLKIAWGYTSDPAKIITLPWRGFVVIEGFIHPHFGNVPVDVYAIKLTDEVK